MQIVILGAGYAGLRTALDLARFRREQGLDISIQLVDQHPYHQLIQLLHLTATAGITDQRSIYHLDRLLQGREIERVEGRVTAIHPLERTVTLADGRNLTYDRLVLALGSETAFNAPGAREHALPLHTFAHAVALRKHIIAQFTKAAALTDPVELRITMTTAIVGGGYTGCELAGELAAWADDLCRQTGAPRTEVRIALIEREDHLLPHLGVWASNEAVRRLERLGVNVFLKTPVTQVEPQRLRFADGRILRAGTIVWGAGVRAPALLAEAGFPTDRIGRVLVDRYLRVSGQALVFAIGDCAAVSNGRGGVLPPTASYAIRQGAHLAEVLAAEARGEAPRAYEPVELGEVVSLGPNDAIGNALGVPVMGYPALMLKRGIEEYYRATIESA
ncbi:NAD(P)/FAD-dependent oxidoreductase [Chloroflexus sp.]|uniref:NAD(P)/FAD-dependent oxidoreductase n=1 Tax=Chloroflexus sp. TaxID=1904827 RepID=UPI00298F2F42|nr:NAD(P)/FAD-dependent oxidoreductase [Chloroflexus sp.]MDW8404556.1 NAD(P)/FAD-dependent oxidoreductase [Chloroflexus sp.]